MIRDELLQCNAATDFDHRWLAEYDFALLDPLRFEVEEYRDFPVTAIVPEPLSNQAKYMPVLMRLRELTDEARGRLLKSIDDRLASGDATLSGLLRCGTGAGQLLSHLRKLLIVRHLRSGQDYLLRYFDPRVMRHLQWILGAEQRGALLGPAHAWAWPCAQGWRVLQRQEADSLSYQLRLEDAQWDSLQRLPLVNAALVELEMVAPGLLRDEGLPRTLDEQLVYASQAMGLREEADWVFCSVQAARFHPEIHEHPRLQKLVLRARAEGTGYADACSELTEGDWLSMAEAMIRRKFIGGDET
nr:DUF4123 domain-containing protein [Cupriavidus taiwanensis]